MHAIRERAEALVESGLADQIVAEKQADRDGAWFEMVRICESLSRVSILGAEPPAGSCGGESYRTCCPPRQAQFLSTILSGWKLLPCA